MTKKQFPLKEKIEELEKIEQYFQRSDINLDDAIEKHRSAMESAKEILGYLSEVENTLTEVDIQNLKKYSESTIQE